MTLEERVDTMVETLRSKFHYERLPEHMQEGVQAYIETGRPTGDFLYAVLTNKLVETFGKADEINRRAIQAWVSWLYNDCPLEARGSEEAVEKWMAQGGLRGLLRDRL